MRDVLSRLNKHVKDKILMGSSPLLQDPQHGNETKSCMGAHPTPHRQHHCPPQEISCMAIKMSDGEIATNGKENMSVFGPHFEQEFNSQRPVDPTILDEVAQQLTHLFWTGQCCHQQAK
jgi:hypothetical protein